MITTGQMGESMRSTAKISSASELGLEPENNSDPERRLWAAVLLQAVEDWRSNNIRANRAAEEFLFKSALDFETVCHGAGFDPSALQTKLRRLQTVPHVMRHKEIYVPA